MVKNITTFNPRSYKRSDTERVCLYHVKKVFQSTLLQEERHYGSSDKNDVNFFQSTLLQEERPLNSGVYSNRITFNPRSYKRSDTVYTVMVMLQFFFQSTLLQEERPISS